MSITIEEVRDTKPGDTVCLTDEQTLSDLMDKGHSGSMDGLELTINSIQHIVEHEDLAEWYVMDVEDGVFDFDLWIMVKIVDNDLDIRVYTLIECGSRDDLVEEGVIWLFDEPLDPEDFTPDTLTFTRNINDDEDNEFVYKYEFYGEVTETPALSGVDYKQFATVVEYNCESDIDNPEMCVLEVGEYITVLHGANINQNDITILNR